MSDMWESLANSALRRHGKDYVRLERAIREFEGLTPASQETQDGVETVLRILRARLAELTPPPGHWGDK